MRLLLLQPRKRAGSPREGLQSWGRSWPIDQKSRRAGGIFNQRSPTSTGTAATSAASCDGLSPMPPPCMFDSIWQLHCSTVSMLKSGCMRGRRAGLSARPGALPHAAQPNARAPVCRALRCSLASAQTGPPSTHLAANASMQLATGSKHMLASTRSPGWPRRAAGARRERCAHGGGPCAALQPLQPCCARLQGLRIALHARQGRGGFLQGSMWPAVSLQTGQGPGESSRRPQCAWHVLNVT